MDTPTRKPIALSEVREQLGAEVICGDDLSLEIEALGAADLLSDVLPLSESETLLLTHLLRTRVIITATIADYCGMVFVRGKRPADEVLSLASAAKVPILSTPLRMYDAAGRPSGLSAASRLMDLREFEIASEIGLGIRLYDRVKQIARCEKLDRKAVVAATAAANKEDLKSLCYRL
jgi:hypothetical protein